MILRTCACGATFEPANPNERSCSTHAPRGRAHRSPTTRAQDAEYRRERARVLQPGPDGAPPRCELRIKCDGAPATTVDHVIPVARGGRHAGNLVPACGPCNFSKRADVDVGVQRVAPPSSSALTALAPRAARTTLRLV